MMNDRLTDRLRRFRTVAVTLAVAAVVTAVAVIGSRLSDEALAVLAGAVCGVGAAIPTSLLIIAVSRWREHGGEHGTPPTTTYPAPYPYPRTPAWPEWPPQYPYLLPPYREPYRPERTFTVVGGDGETGE